jgi:hypothetical protein
MQFTCSQTVAYLTPSFETGTFEINKLGFMLTSLCLLGRLEQMNGFCKAQLVFSHSPPIFFLVLTATQ